MFRLCDFLQHNTILTKHVKSFSLFRNRKKKRKNRQERKEPRKRTLLGSRSRVFSNGKDLWIQRSGVWWRILSGWGCGDWCSHQIRNRELAILAVKRAAQSRCPAIEFVMDETAVEEHPSNRTIEVTVRDIHKLFRVKRSAMEGRLKSSVPSWHPILSFLIKQAAQLMSK